MSFNCFYLCVVNRLFNRLVKPCRVRAAVNSRCYRPPRSSPSTRARCATLAESLRPRRPTRWPRDTLSSRPRMWPTRRLSWSKKSKLSIRTTVNAIEITAHRPLSRSSKPLRICALLPIHPISRPSQPRYHRPLVKHKNPSLQQVKSFRIQLFIL